MTLATLGLAKRYSGYSSVIRSGAAGADLVTLTDIESASITPGVRQSTVRPAGLLDPNAYVMGLADPTLRVTTRDIGKLFDVANVAASWDDILTNGVCVTGVTEFYVQQRQVCDATTAAAPTFQSGAVHEKFLLNAGWIGLRSLNVEQETEDGALAELEVIGFFDEANPGDSPIIQSTAAFSGDVVTPVFNTKYYLGPTYINGAVALATLVDGVMSVRINPGINFEAKRASGDIWPRTGAIVSRQPTISITTTDAAKLHDAISSVFLRDLSTITQFYRAGSEDIFAGRVADAGLTHLKLTATSAGVTTDDISFQNNDDATVTFTIHLKSPFVKSFEAIPQPL